MDLLYLTVLLVAVTGIALGGWIEYERVQHELDRLRDQIEGKGE